MWHNNYFLDGRISVKKEVKKKNVEPYTEQDLRRLGYFGVRGIRCFSTVVGA